MDDETGRQLARIEGQQEKLAEKLDKLQEAIVSLARMEERLVTLFKRMDTYDTDSKDMLRRVGELERLMVGRGQFFRWADRFGVAIIGAAVAVAFKTWFQE